MLIKKKKVTNKKNSNSIPWIFVLLQHLFQEQITVVNT